MGRVYTLTISKARKDNKMKRSHQRIVFECKQDIEKASNSNEPDKLLRVMRRYGRKTVDEAVLWINQDKAAAMGMTMDEYNAWLWSED